MTTEDLSFSPDWAVPPGETLQELLDDLGMSQADLAARLDRPKKLVNEIVQGKAAITADTAIQLERVLGLKTHFWLNLEQNYREALARQRDREVLSKEVDWLKSVPLKPLQERGWVSKEKNSVDQLRAVLDFFGCASPAAVETYRDNLQVAFRMSTKFRSDPMAIAAWLRRGEIEAQEVDCEPYDKGKFKEALQSIRLLTTQPPHDFFPEARQLCAESGVAFVIIPEIPGSRINGTARWLSKEKAMIQLSLRYSWSDIFWFSFFHEAGHLILHNKKKAVFLDEGYGEDDDERQANRFAAEQLIPTESWNSFAERRGFDLASVQRFADELGIHPGIVVGRLQHEQLIRHGHLLSRLKTRFKWVSG